MGNSPSSSPPPVEQPEPIVVPDEEVAPPPPPAPASESTGLLAGEEPAKSTTTSISFSLETLRIIAFVNFDIVMVTCSFLTKYYVPIAAEDTIIYKIFGFNHACNVLDHHPAREVGSILLIFFILPMSLFLILSHLRTVHAYKKGYGIPSWVVTFSKITTPFNFMVTGWCYMWFVNNPDDTYGFLAHYVPYLAFQIMMSLVSFNQVFYFMYNSRNSLPWGISPVWAVGYAVFLAVLTIVYTVYVVSILMGTPVWDSVNNDGDRLFAIVIAKIYSVCVLILPILFSYKERQSGELYTLSFGES